jgi:hypothetical protein
MSKDRKITALHSLFFSEGFHFALLFQLIPEILKESLHLKKENFDPFTTITEEINNDKA